MKKLELYIPILTLLTVASIFFNCEILRAVMVFLFLSFVPGLAILKILKLDKIGLLYQVLFSIGLSLAFSMFTGLVVNEVLRVLGFSQPLSIEPLTIAVCGSTLVFFLIGHRHDFSRNISFFSDLRQETVTVLPVFFFILILPLLSFVGAIYVDIDIMLLLSLVIVTCFILSVVSYRFVPSRFFPLVIFSISLAILWLNLLISKNIIGDDANLEFYVFRLTQVRGYWGSLDVAVNSYLALAYNAMLSVTLLPNVYSVLMNVKGEIVFKILYPFVLASVPLVLYKIYERQTGKLIALLSTFFFISTSTAFFGELTSVNRQVIGIFFFLLSLLLWLDDSLPIAKRRLLIVVFGAALAVSHYTITYVYLVIVSLILLASIKWPKLDDTFDSRTILLLFGIPFIWYAFSSGSLLNIFTRTIENIVTDFTSMSPGAGNAGVVYGLPEAFTTASWINLAVSGFFNLFLAVGFLLVILRSQKIGVSNRYKLLLIIAGVLFVLTLFAPRVAAVLNFTRFYSIALLFLAPCIVLGGLDLLEVVKKGVIRLYKPLARKASLLHFGGFLIIAVLLSAYFLSQSGFVNYVTDGAIHSATFDYYRQKTSDNPQVQIPFYITFIVEQDALSAEWLSMYSNESSFVYADTVANRRSLLSIAMVPQNLILPLTNTTIIARDGFIYLNTINVVKGEIISNNGTFDSSDLLPSLNQTDLIYSNGNSEIWLGT